MIQFIKKRKNNMIAIIDYDMGNVYSLQNMIKKVGGTSVVTNNIEEIVKSDKIILPGVGSFDEGVQNLKKYNLFDKLIELALDKKKIFMGICLGFQLLTLSSEEGVEKGLGLLDANTIKFRFPDNENLKIPHLRWNFVKQKKNSLLFSDMYENPRFYFVHSYYVKPENNDDTLTTTDYGFEFTSSIEMNNILGTQFHPEKSHKFGIKLIENFVHRL